MDRELSYGTLVWLGTEFDKQCKKIGIMWTDGDVRNEAYLDFCEQWQDGEDYPEVTLCGYGYKYKKIA